ncbi:hypothetical protein [Pleionea sediminis]|uniref:hypothetical protein n=1 Tax=Pleionea sediminis TaxID=2569479 RepID=UPI001186F9F7|nr:hypothetical protein [Pleionea sediminis]
MADNKAMVKTTRKSYACFWFYPKIIKLFALSLVYLICVPLLKADSPARPFPLAFTSENSSDVVFTMVPRRYDREYEVEKEAFGVAYKVQEDGTLKELYRTKGWYSSSVFVSRNGRYLVRMGPWSVGMEPAKEDLAIAFYEEGKLLEQYSTADLVKDKSKVVPTVSHYFWQAPSPMDDEVTEAERLRLRLHLDYTNTFELHTIDGWTYTFDVTTGKIKSTKRTKG